MAQKLNLIIDQGTSWSMVLALTNDAQEALDIDNPGEYTFAAQIRKTYSSTNAISMSVAKSYDELTLSLTPNSTSNATPGRYVYDVLLVDSANNYTRIIEGIATIKPKVSDV